MYCRQPLEPDAKELLENYRRLLNDKSEENIVKLRKSKQLLINQVKEIDTFLNLNYSSFGLDDIGTPVQPVVLINYNKSLELLKKSFMNDEVAEDSIFDFKYDKIKHVIFL